MSVFIEDVPCNEEIENLGMIIAMDMGRLTYCSLLSVVCIDLVVWI